MSNHSSYPDPVNPQHEQVLMRLRLELYTAAQIMKGNDLVELKKLIGEIYLVLDLDGGPKEAS